MILRPFFKLLILFALVFFTRDCGAQTFCPPNLDFENGNLGNWQFFTGKCCPINTPVLSGPVITRHELTSGSALDPYGSFPVVGDGVYSLKLGNSLVDSQAERARYYVHVPATAGQYIFMYRYAVVLENPTHNAADQPRFEVKAFDSATNAAISCVQHSYVASANLPGFQLSNVDTQVYYKPWTSASIDLSAYTGKTIAIDFASGDCALGGHFGYGYVDMNCGLFQIQATHCSDTSKITLSGPPGYQSYAWYNAAMTSLLGTGQVLTLNTPSGPGTFALVVTPYAGFGCPDTITATYTSAMMNNMQIDVSNDTTICDGKRAFLTTNSADPNTPFTYQWTPTAGIGCNTCPSTFATASGSYQVVATNAKGCRDTATVVVTVNPTPVANAGKDTAICLGQTAQLSGSGAGSYFWFPSAGLSSSTISNPIVTTSATSGYYLVVTNSYACADTDATSVWVDLVPLAGAGSDKTACEGTPVTLNGTGSGFCSWHPGTGLSNPNIYNPKATPTGTTKYTLVVSNGVCNDTDEVLVTIYPMPVADAGRDTGLCEGTVIALNGSGNGNYSWSPAVNMQNPTWPNPVITAVADTTYTLTVTSAQGCVDSDKVKITVYPVPVANAGSDTILCGPDTVTLKGSGTGIYQWYPTTGLNDPTIASPSVFIEKPIAYFLKVTSSMGCSDSDQVSIGIAPPPVFTVTPMEGEVCPGMGIRFLANGGVYYKWDPPTALSSDNDPDPFARPTENTTYNVHILDLCGNDTTISVDVKMKPTPSIVIDKPNDIDCGYTDVTLTATGAENYVWKPLSGVSDAHVANPVVRPEETTEYTVIGGNKEGCYDTAKITVGVNKDFQLGLPNAFSPDGDGSNDCFRVLVKKQPMQFEISIFNRWGNMVFRTTDINACWDGSYNGTSQPAGVYVYYTKLYFDGCEEIYKVGNVTLLR